MPTAGELLLKMNDLKEQQRISFVSELQEAGFAEPFSWKLPMFLLQLVFFEVQGAINRFRGDLRSAFGLDRATIENDMQSPQEFLSARKLLFSRLRKAIGDARVFCHKKFALRIWGALFARHDQRADVRLATLHSSVNHSRIGDWTLEQLFEILHLLPLLPRVETVDFLQSALEICWHAQLIDPPFQFLFPSQVEPENRRTSSCELEHGSEPTISIGDAAKNPNFVVWPAVLVHDRIESKCNLFAFFDAQSNVQTEKYSRQ
jgi:hypothetical protein